MGKLFTLPLFLYSVRLISAGRVGKEGEMAILDGIFFFVKGKTFKGNH
jgi:hypothetical protein